MNLVVATQAFRRRPLRIAAEDLAAPLRCSLSSEGRSLGESAVIDVSSRGIGIRLDPEQALALGDRIDSVRLEQGEAIVAHAPAEVVNVLEGPSPRAGLRLDDPGVELRNLRLRDGAPVDPGGVSPEAAALPTDWRAAVSELGQVLRWSGFYLDHATRPLADRLTPVHEQAVFSEFFTQWAPRALGSLARLFDLSEGFDEQQRAAAHDHARYELANDVYPGQLPRPPRHGAIDDYDVPALWLAPDFDASTLHARFMRYAWARFPLVRTILARPRWLAELWRSLPAGSARVLVVQPGPAAELAELTLGGRRVELVLLETDASMRARWEPTWRERWAGPEADLHVRARPPTGIPSAAPDEGTYDLIYGAGVLSGLRDGDARYLVRSLHARLREGGRMVLGNLRAEPATSWVLELVLGWRLRYREPDELARLSESLEARCSSYEIDLDPTGRAVLLDVVR